MNFLGIAYLIEKYGLRLTLPQQAEALGRKESTIRNQISADTYGIPTYVEAGKRWADARDVADYFDRCRARAKGGAKQDAQVSVESPS
jgi:hypothetical protein